MEIDHGAMVLVADGRKILFVRNKGNTDFPNLETEEVKQQDNPPDREQASDGTGRGHNSVASHPGSVEQTNFHDLEESRFAAEAAELLKRRALANDFEKLIVVAPQIGRASCRERVCQYV